MARQFANLQLECLAEGGFGLVADFVAASLPSSPIVQGWPGASSAALVYSARAIDAVAALETSPGA